MKVRIPKDIEKYLAPVTAATRLMNAALEMVLWQRHGVRVKWQLKISYFYPKDFQAEGLVAIPMGTTLSSGDDLPADLEFKLTGHQRVSYAPSTEELTEEEAKP